MSTEAAYRTWIGREEVRQERATREPFVRLAALLDRSEPAESAFLPPLGHWLMFLPEASQAALGPDGHPVPGGLYPPGAPPMRMWAGSRIEFISPLPFGEPIERRSRVHDIRQKEGASGPLLFLTLHHELSVGGLPCLREATDIVFRSRSGGDRQRPGERRSSQVSRTITPSTSLLFRFSALTWNAHRIHYDRDYAMAAEGYPGLVVHGPLLATLLMDLFRRRHADAAISAFSFRAQRPVYDLSPFTVNLVDMPDGADLWANDNDGYVAMTARVETSP